MQVPPAPISPPISLLFSSFTSSFSSFLLSLPSPTTHLRPCCHCCCHRLETGVRLNLSQSMSNLARANVRGFIIYITQSGGWCVKADRLFSIALPFTLGGGTRPVTCPGGVALKASEGSREAGRDALQVCVGLFCSPRGRWSSGAAEVTAESSWMGSPAPHPPRAPCWVLGWTRAYL